MQCALNIEYSKKGFLPNKRDNHLKRRNIVTIIIVEAKEKLQLQITSFEQKLLINSKKNIQASWIT